MRFTLAAALLAFSVPAIAQDAAIPPSAQVATPGEVRDPWEKFNRGMWGFNQGVDKVILKPASSVYRTVTPRPARRGLSRVLSNLSEPWSAINALLQGKPGRAGNSLLRFVVNTTIGVGGLADHATGMGLAQTPEDFGQTLAVWGVKSSRYVVLPLLGPSTVRDGIGSGVARFADPYRIGLREWSGLSNTEQYGVTALEVIDVRATLTDVGADGFLDSSADPYATARSAFFQRREAQIADREEGAPGADEDAAMAEALSELDGGAQSDGTGEEAAPDTGPTPAPRQDTPKPATPQ